MASLRKKQSDFARLIAELISWAFENGYELTLGDAYRDPRVHGEVGKRKGYGRMFSCHKLRLAQDLNLFRNGRYLTSTRSHQPLGEKWESMDPRCSWGGHFSDGNHYSFEHHGRR